VSRTTGKCDDESGVAASCPCEPARKIEIYRYFRYLSLLRAVGGTRLGDIIMVNDLEARNMRKWRFWLGTALALSITAPASADPTTESPHIVSPGTGDVDGSFIRPYQAKWRLMGRAKDGSVIQMGTWSDAVKLSKIRGREVLIRRQMWLHDKGAEGYLNIVDRKTLAPVVSQWVNSLGLYRRIEFGANGRSVKFQTTPLPPGEGVPDRGHAFSFADPMRAGSIRLKNPMYDFNTGMFGLLVAGFPLREGYSARFPVFRSYNPKSEPAWIDFRVIGKTKVDAGPGRTLEAWVVVTHSPDTGEVITFDIAKQAPYVISLQQSWEGRDWTFEMM
jgi:hypothetical protein